MQDLQESETGVWPQNSVCGVVWFVNGCMGNALQLQEGGGGYQQLIEVQNKRDVQVPWDSINVVTAALDFQVACYNDILDALIFLNTFIDFEVELSK